MYASFGKRKRELYDPLEELDALSAGISLKNYIQELFKQYLDYIKRKTGYLH